METAREIAPNSAVRRVCERGNVAGVHQGSTKLSSRVTFRQEELASEGGEVTRRSLRRRTEPGRFAFHPEALEARDGSNPR
jgi:hypothetical protein